jgi:hypothetical protein
VVLFPIALVWLGLVVYWAIRRAAADPTGDSPPKWWSNRPRPPREGPHSSGLGAREHRRRERAA